MVDDNLKFTGDVNIDFVEIISSTGLVVNISKQILAISVFEDIMSPFISGNIKIQDSQDLVNLFPLIGEEVVRFSLTTPTYVDKRFSIGGSFAIYKLSTREELSDKSVYYELHFVSTEAVIDMNKKISATIDGSCSDIASKLLTTNLGLETKKQVNIEQTPNGTKFISNFWTPSKCLNYAATNAINENGSPTYLFFENRYGFNFVSVEGLFTNPVYQTFINDNYANSEETRNPEEMYKRVVDISIPTAFDYVDGISEGLYASKLYTYDFVTKKYTSRNFDLVTSFTKGKHLNSYPVASNKIIAKANASIMSELKMYGNFNDYGDVTNTSTLQRRVSFLKILNSTRIEIQVFGKTDYTAGQKVYLKLYKMNQVNEKEVFTEDEDRMFSGNYLIASIHHRITKMKHECFIELVRDSILLDVNK